jgi:hypothetical protein
MHRNIDPTGVPAGRTVVRFTFPDVAREGRDWWLVITHAEADVCDADPGYDVAVAVTASLRSMVRIWRGDVAWVEALREGTVAVEGPEALRRSVATWFTLSPFASVPRPARHGLEMSTVPGGRRALEKGA